MSALSVPPSQKTNLSVGLESIHNYANVPVTLVGGDQYSVVTVYTEVEVGVLEVDEEVMEVSEVQTDFYEEEIVAMSADHGGGEELTSLKAEETSETVDVAKALETLTKTFALKKDSLDQDVQTEKITDSNNESYVNTEAGIGNTTEEEKTHEGCDTGDQTEEQHGGVESLNALTEQKDNESFSEHEENTDVSSELSEAQLCSSSADVRRSTRLQMKTSPSRQETCQIKMWSKEISGEPKMYKKHPYCNPVTDSPVEILILKCIFSHWL